MEDQAGEEADCKARANRANITILTFQVSK